MWDMNNSVAHNIEDLIELGRVYDTCDVQRLLNVIMNYMNDMLQFIRRQRGDAKNPSEGMGYLSTKRFNSILADHGFSGVLMEGEIQLEAMHWQQHSVSLVRLPVAWVLIDFAADQFPEHVGQPLLVAICNPGRAALKATVQAEYRWWVPEGSDV
jgi:hypothetical protein